MRALLLAIPLLLFSRPARAQDPFEIQVYDSETAPPLEPGIEVHFNYVAQGTRLGGPGPHLTFEPHLGLTEWSEVGAYLQTAFLPDGSYDFGGVKARFKARLPRRLAGQVGLALNAELSALPAAFTESRFGAELRPIADLQIEHAYFSINPIVDIDFQGALAGHPQFEPAAKAEVTLHEDQLGLGFEYYGSTGSSPNHRLFAVVDLMQLTAGPTRVALNLGAGYGLAGDEKWTLKSILGIAVP
jgi:hypothetical protein